MLIAIFTFGLNRGRTMDEVMGTVSDSIQNHRHDAVNHRRWRGVQNRCWWTAALSKYIAGIMHGSDVSPILMAWSIAAVLRIALGSATVAAITAGALWLR
ncbi:Gnt-I system [Serratia fonticola]|uniref:Gnt-I system n=1 Tax=Serratia fonticola TaxID=47917 RepID=A0A4U9TML1_SERFO|nr:Gnt-I system [Serratia fonticola]